MEIRYTHKQFDPHAPLGESHTFVATPLRRSRPADRNIPVFRGPPMNPGPPEVDTKRKLEIFQEDLDPRPTYYSEQT